MTSPSTHPEFAPAQREAGADTSTLAPSSGTHIHFPACPKPTIGVELEVSLIDLESRNLAPRAPEVLAAFEDRSQIKPELFRTIVELNSNVCKDVGEIRADLQGMLKRLDAVCQPLGLGTVCTGSHPIADWRYMPITQDDRYRALVEHMAWPARRMLICGVHTHVGCKSGEHAIAVMNALTVFLPHFLALSASSPYWHGIDTGMASCRSKVFEGLPTAGLPPAITNWGEFVSLMRTFLQAGSIKSVREIWWDIRPHPTFGTVELRICDGINTLTEICSIVAFVQCLVDYMQELYDHGEALPELKAWTLAENKWRAARFGLEARIIRNEHGEMVSLAEHIQLWVERLAPNAQKLGCTKELLGVLRILEHGPSSVRQRKLFDASGRLETVVDGLMHELHTDRVWNKT